MTTYIIILLNLTTFTTSAIPVEFKTLQACTFAVKNMNDATVGTQSAYCTATSGTKFPGQPGGVR